MVSSAQSERKAELRALARRITTGNRDAAAVAALRRLDELGDFARARTIAFYSAIGDELPIEAAAVSARVRGARTLYPIQTETGLEMALVKGEDELISGPGRVKQPAPDASRIPIDEIDVFIVPGLLFDRACRRLGRGGGHYDRFLKRARIDAVAIGICSEKHVVEDLPEDSWDVAMSVVVTDRFVVLGGSRGDQR